MNVTNDSQQTKLASNFTVAQYKVACGLEDKDAIVDALRLRFTERYIDPIAPGICNHTHGFTMMAISCLMIESLQSFCEGWVNTKGQSANGKSMSEEAFTKFFDSHNQFDCFRGQIAHCFWVNIRCGILHQAETTGGWRVTRKAAAPLFDATSHKINAALFLKNLRDILEDFCNRLKSEDWKSDLWIKVRTKMDALCENCKT
jgi:hypothetical protein